MQDFDRVVEDVSGDFAGEGEGAGEILTTFLSGARVSGHFTSEFELNFAAELNQPSQQHPLQKNVRVTAPDSLILYPTFVQALE